MTEEKLLEKFDDCGEDECSECTMEKKNRSVANIFKSSASAIVIGLYLMMSFLVLDSGDVREKLPVLVLLQLFIAIGFWTVWSYGGDE